LTQLFWFDVIYSVNIGVYPSTGNHRIMEIIQKFAWFFYWLKEVKDAIFSS